MLTITDAKQYAYDCLSSLPSPRKLTLLALGALAAPYASANPLSRRTVSPLVPSPVFYNGAGSFIGDVAACDNTHFIFPTGPSTTGDSTVEVFNNGTSDLSNYSFSVANGGAALNQAQHPFQLSQDRSSSDGCSIPYAQTLVRSVAGGGTDWQIEVGNLETTGRVSASSYVQTNDDTQELKVTSVVNSGNNLFVGCRAVDLKSGIRLFKFVKSGNSYNFAKEERLVRGGTEHGMDPELAMVTTESGPMLVVAYALSDPTNIIKLEVLDLDMTRTTELRVTGKGSDLENVSVKATEDNLLLVTYSGGTNAATQNVTYISMFEVDSTTNAITQNASAELSTPGMVAYDNAWNDANDEFIQVWTDGAGVFVNRGTVGTDASVALENLGCLFDLPAGGPNVVHIGAEQFTNGKLAVGVGFADGTSKVWIGDVELGAASSAAPAATSEAASSGTVPTSAAAAESSVPGADPTSAAAAAPTSVAVAAPTSMGGVAAKTSSVATVVVGSGQASSGGSSMIGIAAGAIAGVVALIALAIFAVLRRRAHSQRKVLGDQRDSFGSQSPLNTDAESVAECVVMGMMSPHVGIGLRGGVLGGGAPPALPADRTPNAYEDEPEMYAEAQVRDPNADYVTGVQRGRALELAFNPGGEKGDVGLYRNGGMLDGGGDPYRLPETHHLSAAGTHMSEPPRALYDDVEKGVKQPLRPRAQEPGEGMYGQPEDALSPELEQEVEGDYANRAELTEKELAEQVEMRAKVAEQQKREHRKSGSTVSAPLDTSTESEEGTPPETPVDAQQMPAWMGKRESTLSIKV
ncbi:MAG: hypothetical protein P0S94_05535 [Simkaniaceae bacterium]|nr:hypothetical protein [Simkaniaceae bacterium]